MSRKQRSYSLLFGKPLQLTEAYFTAPLLRGTNPVINLESYYNEDDPNAYLITEHEISFTVNKGTKSNNNAKIVIDNLSENTINYLLSNRTQSLVVMLKVGYDGFNKLLLQGTLKDCTVSKSGDTSKTEISVTDGGLNTSSAYTSRVYPVGTKAQKIVDDLILDLATPSGYVEQLPSDLTIKSPFTVFGETNRNLQRFLMHYGYDSTINNGKCYVLPIDSRLDTNSAYISPETGLIGNVKGITENGNPKESTEVDTSGFTKIRFTCQIDASIQPQSSVFVKDDDVGIEGAFKVDKAFFRCGSFESGDFVCIVEAVKTSQTISGGL
jgi:hypothetical protein